MKINELFFSIQAEGPTTGQPAIFVRLSGCNRKCWFCDSKYHTHTDSNLTEQSILNLLEKNPNCNRIIFTGGEPLLQQDVICDFLIKNWMILRNKNIEFETNGSVKFEEKIKIIMKDNLYNFHFNISPKLTSSGNVESGCCYYQFKNIIAPNTAIFKFVYISNHSFEILNYIKNHLIPKNKVYVMPEGCLASDQKKLMPEVVEFCKEHGFTFSPRIQVLIWDDKQGV